MKKNELSGLVIRVNSLASMALRMMFFLSIAILISILLTGCYTPPSKKALEAQEKRFPDLGKVTAACPKGIGILDTGQNFDCLYPFYIDDYRVSKRGSTVVEWYQGTYSGVPYKADPYGCAYGDCIIKVVDNRIISVGTY